MSWNDDGPSEGLMLRLYLIAFFVCVSALIGAVLGSGAAHHLTSGLR